MNSVDIEYHVNKYNNYITKRHISFSHDTEFFFKKFEDNRIIVTDVLISTNNYINVVTKHKNKLNMNNINTITYCVFNNIKITPDLYKLNNNDIVKLIDIILRLCKVNNYFMKTLKNINFPIDIREYLQCAYEDGNINVIKFFHKKFTSITNFFQTNKINNMDKFTDFNIIKYLHKKIKLSKENFCFDYNWYGIYYFDYIFLCQKNYNAFNHISIIKYLHKHVKLTKKDFQEFNTIYHILTRACIDDHIDTVRYIFEEIKITNKDIQLFNGDQIYRIAHENNNTKIVEYLNKKLIY